MNSGVVELIKKEEERQRNTLTLIASENYTYPEVRAAMGSFLMHKYSEGYPGKRYYQGNRVVDEIEILTIETAKKLFGVAHVNVQPYSGSPANAEVYLALLEPHDTILGMELSAGGHLTHGHPKVTFSGKYFNSFSYGLRKEDENIDYEAISRLAHEHKPKIIIAGASAYSRAIDWKKIADVADEVGAYFMADISHIAGLVAGGVHSSPVEYCHIITTTTHKTLRGPRGALIMVTEKGLLKDPELSQKIDKAVFPGFQGGPHNNQTAAICIALQKALLPEFGEYASKVCSNASVLAQEISKNGFRIVSGGTDNHMFLVDLSGSGITGREAADRLNEAGIVVNANSIPFDNASKFNPSGIRLGSAACTSRGMGEEEMVQIGGLISEVLKNISDDGVLAQALEKVSLLCKKFPIE